MPIKRQERQIKRGIGDAGIWLENRKYSNQTYYHKKRLSPESYGQAANVRGHVQPEHSKEERAKRVEHLDEEIPPQPNIGREVLQ